MERLSTFYKNKIGVYFIKNAINGKVYIGSSSNLYKRILDHINTLKKNVHQSTHLQNSVNKYGINNFIVEIFDTYKSVEFIAKIEPLLIKLYDCTNDKFGYNLTQDYKGSHGMKFTEERCHNISNALRGRVAHNKCVPMSESQKIELRKVGLKRAKSVNVFLVSGEFVETVQSIMEVVRSYKIDKRSVQRVLSGEYSQFKGFVFKFH